MRGDVVGELGDEDGVGELFEEDGREIEVAIEADVVTLEIAEYAQEREVSLCRGLVQPLHAMGPGAVIDDIGQVGVQGEGQESCWFGGGLRQVGCPLVVIVVRCGCACAQCCRLRTSLHRSVRAGTSGHNKYGSN